MQKQICPHHDEIVQHKTPDDSIADNTNPDPSFAESFTRVVHV